MSKRKWDDTRPTPEGVKQVAFTERFLVTYHIVHKSANVATPYSEVITGQKFEDWMKEKESGLDNRRLIITYVYAF